MSANCVWVLAILIQVIKNVASTDFELYDYLNRSDPVTRQLYEFKLQHPKPIGIITTSSGKLVEIRETNALNSDSFSNLYHVDLVSQTTSERIPERVVHAKGAGAFGYFEVTNDVTKFTKADLFNGVGKQTPVVVRFSTVTQDLGGNDLAREMKGLAVKFYTQEGNLDLLCIQFPVYFYKNPLDFTFFTHAFKRNPKTNIYDNTMRINFITKRPDTLHGVLWFLSDFAIPNGYRKMDAFPIHTYVLYNKVGEKYYARFNFISEQGLENLSSQDAAAIASRDPDYYVRDLYNAIENKTYPAWRLEMEVMTSNDIKTVDYDPFEVTRMWKKGTYITVQIGRLVLDRNPDNFFKAVEQSAFNPANLVPGIPGPVDEMFKSRRFAYRETQIHRLGVNHNKIRVNRPLYSKGYNRDGVPPILDNMVDAPNYYPDSFNGPVPYVDIGRPKERISLLESNAVDLEPAAYFYNYVLENNAQRARLVNNTVSFIVNTSPELQRRFIRLLTLTDPVLGQCVEGSLVGALQAPPPPSPQVLTYNRKKIYENYEPFHQDGSK